MTCRRALRNFSIAHWAEISRLKRPTYWMLLVQLSQQFDLPGVIDVVKCRAVDHALDFRRELAVRRDNSVAKSLVNIPEKLQIRAPSVFRCFDRLPDPVAARPRERLRADELVHDDVLPV